MTSDQHEKLLAEIRATSEADSEAYRTFYSNVHEAVELLREALRLAESVKDDRFARHIGDMDYGVAEQALDRLTSIRWDDEV